MFLLKAYDRERFGDKSDHTFQWNGDPASLSEEQRKKLLEHLFSIACNGDAHLIEQTRKQIEAEASQAVVDVEAVPV